MRTLTAGLMVLTMAACGVSNFTVDERNGTGNTADALSADNGRPYNGRPYNGKPVNGRPYNGRPYNGYAYNGYAWGMRVVTGLNSVLIGTTRDADFDTWFNADPAGANIAMKYLFKCAAPTGTTITYTATTGVTYSWPGLLSVAPRWVTTSAAQVSASAAVIAGEEERVTSCLLGLTNSAGISVQISARGDGIAVGGTENNDFPNIEGGFYGNMFLATPQVYSCQVLKYGSNCGDSASCPTSKGRTCADKPGSCGIVSAGSCYTACTGFPSDATGYTSCKSPDGKVWSSVFTTRVKGWCGDFVCQTNEVCNPNCMDCAWRSTCGNMP